MTTLIFFLFINLMNFQNQVPITLDEAFTVVKQESAFFSEQNMTLKVLKIMDSRCPENTNCIWAGELSAEIEIEDTKSTKSYVLTIPAAGPSSKKARMKIGEYELIFLGQPKKKTKKSITPDNDPMQLEFILVSESKEADNK